MADELAEWTDQHGVLARPFRRMALCAVIRFVEDDRGFHDPGQVIELEQQIAGGREIDRYLLVEQGRDGAWLTLCGSAKDAADTHLGQEYREDWEPLGVVDLDTGKMLDPVLSLTWSEEPATRVFNPADLVPPAQVDAGIINPRTAR